MLAARILTALVFGAAITAAILFAPSPVTAAVLAVLWLAGVWEWAAFAQLPACRTRRLHAALRGRHGARLVARRSGPPGLAGGGPRLVAVRARARPALPAQLQLHVRRARRHRRAVAVVGVARPLARRRRARRGARVHAARHRLGGRRRRLRVRPAARPDQARARREPGQDVGGRDGRPRDGGARRRDRGALARVCPSAASSSSASRRR